MSSQIAAPAVTHHKAGLALLLALLGVPGTTIAWELPAGGLWIGLPLAVAAIAVGISARAGADRTGRRIAMAAIVLGAVEILFMASWTVAG